MPSDATMYRAAGVNAKTAAGYDRLLENLFTVDVVPAWSTIRLSRLIKQSTRYVVDCGLATVAAGLDTQTVLSDGDLLGRSIDAFTTAQLRAEIVLSQS